MRVSGGDGVTYYWPSGRIRVDGADRNPAAAGCRGAGRARPAARRRADERRGAASRLIPPAGRALALAPVRFTARARRLDRRSTPSPCSTGRSRAGACAGCASRSTAGSAARRRLRFRPRLHRSALRQRFRRARCGSARRGCRFARSARRSSIRTRRGPLIVGATRQSAALAGQLGKSPFDSPPPMRG